MTPEELHQLINDLLTKQSDTDRITGDELRTVLHTILDNLPSGGVVIDDAVQSLTKVYSSQKVEDEFTAKVDQKYSLAEKNKLGSIDATHYGAPLQSIADLQAITSANRSDKQRHYVENELSDYFYDAQATVAGANDVIPTDQVAGTGIWRKVAVGGETASSIKTKYESNPDTNALTDVLKSELETAYGWGNHALAGYLTATSNLSWSKVTGRPTTLAGYGITDAASFPSVAGNNGKFLTTDGTNVMWGSASGGVVLQDGTTPLTGDWTAGNHSIILTDSVGSSYGKIYYDFALRGLKIQTAYAGTFNSSYVLFSPNNGGGAPAISLSSGLTLSGTSLTSNQSLNLSGANSNSSSIITINNTNAGNGATSAFSFTNEIKGTVTKASTSINRVGIHTGITCSVNHSVIASSYEALRITSIETSLPIGPNFLFRAGIGNGSSTYSSLFDIANTGEVGINVNGIIDPSAILQITSTSKGLLGPRMTLSNWNSISTPAEGLQGWNTSDHGQMWFDGTASIGFRYNRTTLKFQGYDGTNWIDLN